MKPILRHRLILLGILLGGTILRLFRLGADSLWYDETVSTALAGSPLRELLRHTAGDIHPPGYYILLRGWLLLTGYPTGHADPHGTGLEFAAGFLSLIFGVLLIALVYALARRVASRPVALVAAALIAVSPYNIWYSQEVRMYTLAAALGVVVVYAFIRNSEFRIQNSGRRWWAVYALAAAAGMYTLYYFVFLLIPLNLWVLWRMADGKWQIANGQWRMAKSGTPAAARRRLPVSSIQPPTSNLQPPTSSLQPPASSFQLPASNAQPPASSFQLPAWLLANLAAVLLYAPWIPIAWRQATDPPVPPWRTAPDLLGALRESWTALSLGQSAPNWLWPVLLLTVGLYALGLVALWQMADGRWQMADGRWQMADGRWQMANGRWQMADGRWQMANGRWQMADGRWLSAIRYRLSAIGYQLSAISHQLSATGYLPLAALGPLALILLVSAITPLYHVRYIFTYSPAFYVVMAAGLAWLARRSRVALAVAAICWLAAAGVTLNAFWADSAYRADDHRAAVRFLQEHWRPGDVVLVDAGWVYTALTTYWDGPVADRTRLTGDVSTPRADGALVMVTAGHVNSNSDSSATSGRSLGWGDPRSDFFAMPAEAARQNVVTLFRTFDRVWLYRIYDTVNDPGGEIRAWLAEDGQIFEDQTFSGEANMRVQGYVPRQAATPNPGWPSAAFGTGLALRVGPLPVQVVSGETLYPVLDWQPAAPLTDFATSIRLVGPDSVVWAQPPDERPSGSLFPAGRWSIGQVVRQTLALPVPSGTPPGQYAVELVVYDPATGKPWPAQAGDLALTPNGLRLGEVTVERPQPSPSLRPALATFGPLALIEAASPATTITPGGQAPVDLLWQAVEAPAEPLVIVVQLQDAGGRVVAGLEAQPLAGRYPTQNWAAGELVRDRHTLSLPADLAPGAYRLIVGAYRAGDRVRLETRDGLFGKSNYWVMKTVKVR